jgi:hypothetical protein
MDPSQIGGEYHCRSKYQERLQINDRARERDQRDPKQPDSRRSGEASECLKPPRILELVHELGGKIGEDDRDGEYRRRRGQSSPGAERES